MTSLKDIARKAGVAKSTVSRYLNNGQVSEKTKEKIRQVIEETGYQPNMFARSLKADSSKMVGVVIPRFDSASTTLVLEGIDRIAHSHDIQLLIANSNLDREREKQNINVLASQKVAGIILIATHIDKSLIKQINKLEMPIILVGQRNDKLSYIAHDDYEAGKKIAQYAIESGHKKCLYVGVSEEDESVGILRKQGFLDTMIEAGEKPRVIETSFSRQDNYKKALSYLKNSDATYVACATDYIAMAVVKAAQELGFVISDDLSISGFGGYNEFEFVTPTLTTVRYSFEESGEKALKFLMELISGKESGYKEILSNQLIKNQSTQAL